MDSDEGQGLTVSFWLDKLNGVPLDMLKGQREPLCFFNYYILRVVLRISRRLENKTYCEKMQIKKVSKYTVHLAFYWG